MDGWPGLFSGWPEQVFLSGFLDHDFPWRPCGLIQVFLIQSGGPEAWKTWGIGFLVVMAVLVVWLSWLFWVAWLRGRGDGWLGLVGDPCRVVSGLLDSIKGT